MQESVRFQPGDRLLLYTDGITECMGRTGAMWGEKRLIDFVKKCDQSGDALLSELVLSLKEFHGGDSFEDDVSAVLLDF